MSNSKFEHQMDITVEEHFEAIASQLVSLVRALEKSLGEQRAHQMVSDWAERQAVEDVRSIVEELDEPIQNFEDVKLLLHQWVNDLNKNNIEEVTITEEDETKSLCMVTQCVHARVFEKLDATEIGYLLHCKQDFPATPAIHPDVRLRRSKTLMQGEDCCDFEYYWKE
ncbi:MAG: L-2-amino-thiazoline-4-carboxylic acid hydrolase [Candidatus Thorarchaeota archaeon]